MAEKLLNLLARQAFKAGELGYATAEGVSHMRRGFVPDDGFMVRAAEDVKAGQSGNFEELKSKSK